jgi:DNA-binding transcriptional ArsR family regulator
LAPPEPRGGASRDTVRSLVADADHWVSAPLVRQAIGAWAYAAATPERRPSEQAVRDAVSVACALHELTRGSDAVRWARAGTGAEQGQGRARVLPLDPAGLGERSGLEPAAVVAALALLEQAGALTRWGDAGGTTGTLTADVLAPQPAVSRLAWDEARRRVRAVPGSLAPALAVLREMAASLGALAEDEAPPPVRVSVRDLEERTGYGRSTVAEALGTLERARVLDVESRAGRTTRFTLRPAAFGQVDEPARGAAPVPGTLPGVRLGASAAVGGVAVPAASVAVPGPPTLGAVMGGAPVLLGEFAGTPIYGPPGTPLVVDCDAAGRWTCRVGPLLTLGPVAPG